MCGIIGVTGVAEPSSVLLASLKALEYRGYDSAGVAFVDDETGTIQRLRAAERAASIEKLAGDLGTVGTGRRAAIGHTRWATHGAPTTENAHPHLDCGGHVAVVHNGIIENYRQLGEGLRARGHRFSSQTDTEVVVHLIEEALSERASLLEATRAVLHQLRGDFALAIVSAAEPDVLVAARRTSPLLIGMAEGAGYLASDAAALLPYTRDLYLLSDDEVAEVRPGSFRVLDLAGDERPPRRFVVSWDAADAQREGFPDFMSKEIREQPRALRETLIGRVRADGTTDLEELGIDADVLASLRRVVLVAAGSSYHAALVGRSAIEQLCRVPAEADLSSEFRYRDAVLGPDTLAVVVSQSGETVDTLHAMREASRLGARTVALTNVVDSLMAREADGVLYTRAGPEIGVASTKCHLAQLAMLEVFALHLARVRGAISEESSSEVADALLRLPGLVEVTLGCLEHYEAIARRFASDQNFYFLGRRLGYPVAMEGALKLKELAYVRAEAYAAGEMKHGPISLIEPGSVVVVVATRTPLWEKVISNVEEMRARGATIVALADENDTETAALADAVLPVPHASELTSPIVDVVPLQAFAYAIARARGNNVDRPRNLAKVVTVE